MPSIGDITGRIVIIDKGTGALVSFTKSLETHAKRAEALGKRLSDIGQSLTTKLTLPLAALGGIAVKTAMEFESSFAGVRKTVDATEEEFKKLETQIRALAAGPDAIPIDVNKLNAVAEAAGQLGIAKGDIIAFTRTMADLGETTNLTADEAATATAQFQNIFGAAGKEVDRFGSTLVALGNAGASTEKDIISMGLRIAGAGVQLGLSQGQVLAYASSLSSMGIEAEAGGSAISKVMIDIALAVSKGGKELTNFASVSGMSAEQFKVAFKTDAAGAVASFIEGLGRMKVSGQDVLGTLDAMGITEIRMRDALLRASGAGDLLRDSLRLQGEAWRDNNALTSEAEKRYQTFESQLKLFLNRVKDITITFGTALLPALLDALDAAQPWIETLKSMAEGFANTSPAFKTFIISIAAITAAIGPAVFITGQLLLAWSHIVAAAAGVAGAMNSVAMATKGLVVVGALLFINELIKAWGRASDAVTQYNLEVAKIEGNALAFAQQVSQGTLNKVIGQGTFDQKIKEADILAGHIKRVSGEVDRLNKAIKEGAGDQVYLAKQKLPEKEQELKNLWAAHNKLRSALAEVTIAGEKAEEAFNPSPFAGLAKDGDKAIDILGGLLKSIERAKDAMDLLRQGRDIGSIEALVSAAEMLEKGSLFDGTVKQIGALVNRLKDLQAEFTNAIKARDLLFAARNDLDDLIKKQFDNLPVGGNDPEMQKLIANLRAVKQLTDSVATEEERKTKAIAEALALGIEGETLQRILLANADQWNIELDETQVKFNEIYEKLSYVAEGIAYDLVSNWRRAWEENESIVDATVDTLRDSFLNVLQDIISQWLSAWFKAMAAWLARWIATQRIAQASSAQTAAVSGASGAGGGLGSLFGMGSAASGASTAGVSTSTMLGAGLAAFALYVVYKGFIEDHKRKFAQVTITDGQWDLTAAHGKKYLDGVQSAAESIVNNLKAFLAEIDVTMTKLGTVIISSSKAGWNVSIPGSTGKLFSSMEEAISYAQVLMLKYGEFADSVSLLVRSVIASSKAISIDQLASDIDFARLLDTQNFEQAAQAVASAMDTAMSQWKRAEELFLSFYSVNLPAFEAAVDSIITKLTTNLTAVYNQLAGIEEDPKAAWERQRLAYNAQRAIVMAQLKLWELEIAARIAAYNAQVTLIGGGGRKGGQGEGATKGTGIYGFASAMLTAAGMVNAATAFVVEGMDAGLQALLDIQAQLIAAQAQMPPPLNPEDYKPPKRRGGKGDKGQLADLREDLLDEIDRMAAEASGPLHVAFYDLNANIEAFRERAKEAKLPAAELARGVELLAEAFRRSIRQQALDYAGLESEFTKRLRDIGQFFDEVEALGYDATGLTANDIGQLEGQALDQLGKELLAMITEFGGLIDPMLAINMRANEMRTNLLAFAEAAGWSAEQIAAAQSAIDAGIEFQRQQGINSILDKLFGYLTQAGLFEAEAMEFARQKAIMDLALIEAQLRFYGALTAQTQAWIDAARGFVNSPAFNQTRATNSDPLPVKVVATGPNPWQEFTAGIRDLIKSWREGIEQFAQATKDLMTDESVTNLTQAQQLEFARSEVERVLALAKTGDLDALAKLDAARREYLSELRESEGGGFGYDKGFDWIMGETAGILAGAQEAEEELMTREFKKLTDAWELSVIKLSDELRTTLYDTTNELVNAIYNAIAGVPAMASGGVVMSGPRLVRVAEYVPEAIVPLDRLASMVPYRAQDPVSAQTQQLRADKGNDHFQSFLLARMERVERSNTDNGRILATIRNEMRRPKH